MLLSGGIYKTTFNLVLSLQTKAEIDDRPTNVYILENLNVAVC